MSKETRSLVALTAACTFAAALFGFGADVFSFRSVYEGSGREGLLLLSRLLVYLAFAGLLVFRGGWRGVLAAFVMVLCATAVEWALIPVARGWAGLGDPTGYAERFGEGRPSYRSWVLYDVIGVGIAAAFTRGLIMLSNVNPRGRPDE